MTAIWNNTKQIAIALIAWNTFDIVLHIVVDQVEALRITGNIVAIAAGAIIGWTKVSNTQQAGVAGLALAAVLGLNVAWALYEGKWWPPVATVLITGTFLLLSRLASLSAKAMTESTTA